LAIGSKYHNKINQIRQQREENMDFTTRYLGMTLKKTFVPSASPLSRSIDDAKRLEDKGAAAIIMYSQFEEAVTAEEDGSPMPRRSLSSWSPELHNRPGGAPPVCMRLDGCLRFILSMKASRYIQNIMRIRAAPWNGARYASSSDRGALATQPTR
jgi:hypothetical protein